LQIEKTEVEKTKAPRILIVRLSSMGDVIHTLPAAAALRRSFPESTLNWLIRPRWAPLLEANPHVDRAIPLAREAGATLRIIETLRQEHFDLAVDFQGLMQSAGVAKAAGAARLVGFGKNAVRERLAASLYSETVEPASAHVVDRNMELASAAAGVPVESQAREFPLPAGKPEGALPAGPFVLASPLAGWGSKQWPLERWSELAALLELPLVVNGPPSSQSELSTIKGALVHLSGVPGLIDATRRATAVIGLDSGPLHLAAALAKPGVALFGPTDPARNGPYGTSFRVLRDAQAITDYHRHDEPDGSMRAIMPAQVAEALHDVLEGRAA
jgi:lipopolysaccharide heptosyltransferase I